MDKETEEMIEAMRKDAERYRFLRSQKRLGRNGGVKFHKGFDVVYWGNREEGDILTFEKLDAAIDAAIAKATGN